jgi:hypothetical protein
VKTVAAVCAALLLLTGCGSSDDPEPEAAPTSTAPTSTATTPAATTPPAAEPAGTVVDIAVKDGRVTPQGGRVEVEAGNPVTLRIVSDAAEEIHVHSDPEHTYEVAAGESIEKSFTPETPGQVAIEAHELGVTIVQLVVRP